MVIALHICEILTRRIIFRYILNVQEAVYNFVDERDVDIEGCGRVLPNSDEDECCRLVIRMSCPSTLYNGLKWKRREIHGKGRIRNENVSRIDKK